MSEIFIQIPMKQVNFTSLCQFNAVSRSFSLPATTQKVHLPFLSPLSSTVIHLLNHYLASLTKTSQLSLSHYSTQLILPLSSIKPVHLASPYTTASPFCHSVYCTQFFCTTTPVHLATTASGLSLRTLN